MTGGVLLSSRLEASAELFRYKSGKPLYAKVALNADESMILRVAFDESKGTGTGYDMLYADVNSNGKNSRVQRLTGRSRRQARGMRSQFPAIKVNIPYKNKPVRSSYPCEVTFSYQKYSSPTRAASRASASSTGAALRTQESFAISSAITLRQGSDQWQYSFQGSIKPSQTLESAPVWKFLQAPQVTITTRPDGRKKGNLGIGLDMVAGQNEFQCKKGAIPAKAHVEIRRGDGRIVHRGSGPLNKFTFG